MFLRADSALSSLSRRLRYRYGGIDAISARLMLVPRVEGVLSEFGAEIGPHCVLHGPLVIHNAVGDYGNLHVGANVHIGRLVLLDLAAPIHFEADCTVSMGTTILTHADVGDRPLATRHPRVLEATRIGAGSYLGANVTVLPGCHIGRQAVVGAGAVVTRQVPDGAIVAGIPARALEYDRAADD